MLVINLVNLISKNVHATGIITNEEEQNLWGEVNACAFKASCELELGSMDPVAGTLCKFESEGHPMYLFISTNSRLLVDSPDDLSDAKLLLQVKPEAECKTITLRDKVRQVWCSRPRVQHSGNTIVELSEEATKECELYGAHFLPIGKARPGEEVSVIEHFYFIVLLFFQLF